MLTDRLAVRLGDVLAPARDSHVVDPSRQYPNVGIYSFGRGVFAKSPIEGRTTSATTLYRVRAGQFIYSRLFAFEGAYGLVPNSFDGYFVSNEFPTFDCDASRIVPRYLEWFVKRSATWKEFAAHSTGMGSRRQRIHPDELLECTIPLPALNDQNRFVDRMDKIVSRTRDVTALRLKQQSDAKELLLSAFRDITADAPSAAMTDVAPLVRRPVALDYDTSYPELGVRSFFKGTFRKPALTALELGSKRVFWIEPGDLVFSNVFAWEGAIAIARPEDRGRVGSHRFMTCASTPGVAEARFLLQYFQTEEGFSKIKAASPGGAGRNRTLGVEALAEMRVPLPSVAKQRWFAQVHRSIEAIGVEQAMVETSYDALVSALLERAFQRSG